jgi:hypothetical protein
LARPIRTVYLKATRPTLPAMAPSATPDDRDPDRPTKSQRPSRTRCPTSKAKAIEADTGIDSLESPSTPTNPKAGGQPPKSNDPITDALAKIVSMIGDLKGEIISIKEEIRSNKEEVKEDVVSLKEEVASLKKEIASLRERVDTLSQPTSPTTSYASVAKSANAQASTQPSSHASPVNSSSINPWSSISATPSVDAPFCTIDTSRVEEGNIAKTTPPEIRKMIEKGIRAKEGMKEWRCKAVTRDPRNIARTRIICQDEEELKKVKEVAEQAQITGLRVLRDQYYPVKVDNANRTAVLDEKGEIRPGAAETLGKENNITIAKLVWLSKKDTHKLYGSMVVYTTKSSEAIQLLNRQFFDIAGESAYTRIYELRTGPLQCYNCQEMGHKAFSCKKPQVCGKCANEGHHHKECASETPKCIPCGGPHESFSKSCLKLHPVRHE